MTKGVKRYFDGERKQCGNCFEIKPVSEFGSNLHSKRKTDSLQASDGKRVFQGKAGDYRSQCKQCRSDICYNIQQNKRIEKRPNKFWECEECDVYNSDRVKICRHCGSEKIQLNYGGSSNDRGRWDTAS